MIKIITSLLTKIIPSNWYEVKKQCDIITKICDTLIELKWFVFPTITIVVVCICVMLIYFFKYKLTRLITKVKGE